MYFVNDGFVRGGSCSKRKVNKSVNYSDKITYGGTFTFEFDLSKRLLVMETGGEVTIIDSKIGDYEFSPLILGHSDSEIEVTIL